ncbi:hypothetical protein MD484_g5035, partial [Candolleomyces efflorescens]
MSSANPNPELLPLDAQFTTVEHEIGELMSLLQEKQQIRRDLLTRRERLGRSSVPGAGLGDFPLEIVGRILGLVIPSDLRGSERELQTNRLRLVSPKWNALVLDDPAFWSRLTLVADNKEQFAPAVERATSNLKKNESIFLHVEIHLSQSLKPLTPFLARHSPRISSLTLFMGRAWTNNAVSTLNAIAARAPWKSLQSMAILWHKRFEPGKGIQLKDEHYPALRKLELGAHCRTPSNIPIGDLIPGDPFLSDWEAPFSQLTSITLSNLHDTLADHLTMLQQCENLVRLAIRASSPEDMDDNFSEDSSEEPVTLPMLRYLDLLIFPSSHASQEFLDRLTAPSIQSVVYTDHTRPPTSEQPSEYSTTILDSLGNMIARSTESLESLEINFSDPLSTLDDQVLLDLFPCTPQLKNLAISAPNMTCDFLVRRDSGENHGLPPSLERLRVTALRPVEDYVVEKKFKEWISHCEADDVLNSTSAERTCIDATLEIEEVVTRVRNRAVPMWGDRT